MKKALLFLILIIPAICEARGNIYSAKTGKTMWMISLSVGFIVLLRAFISKPERKNIG
jgi:hypothetical protein